MKIITEGKVYVQRGDITNLLNVTSRLSIPIPSPVIEKCFSNGFTCTNDNRYEFLEFDDIICQDFFKKLKYIVDYSQFKYSSPEEIDNYYKNLIKKRNEILDEYNKMVKEEQKHRIKDISAQCLLIELQIMSVRDILWYKQGLLKIDFPIELQENELFFKKKQKAKTLIKNVFKKNK